MNLNQLESYLWRISSYYCFQEGHHRNCGCWQYVQSYKSSHNYERDQLKQELETRIECLEDDFQSKCQEKDNYIETLKEINQGLVLKLKREESLLAESTQVRETLEQECADIIKTLEMEKDQEIQELKLEITKLKDNIAVSNDHKLEKGVIEEVDEKLDSRPLANDTDTDACKNEVKSEDVDKSTIQLEQNQPKKEELLLKNDSMDDIPLKNDPSKELTLENYPIEDIEDIKQDYSPVCEELKSEELKPSAESKSEFVSSYNIDESDYSTSVMTRTAARFEKPAVKLKISIVLDQDTSIMRDIIKFDSDFISVRYLEDNVEEEGDVSDAKETSQDPTLKPAPSKRSRSAEYPQPAVKRMKKSTEGENRVECKYCQKQIKKTYLKKHIRYVHKKEHSNQCTKCPQCNDSIITTNLFTHMKKKHKIDRVNNNGETINHNSSPINNPKEKWVIPALQNSTRCPNKVKNGGKVLSPKPSNKLVSNKTSKLKQDLDKIMWERMAALHEEGGSNDIAEKPPTNQVDVNDTKENTNATFHNPSSYESRVVDISDDHANKALHDSTNATEDNHQEDQELVGAVCDSSNVLRDNNKVDNTKPKEPVLTKKSSDQYIIQDNKTKMLKYVQVFEERMAYKRSICASKCKDKICSECEAKCRKMCKKCKRMLVEKKPFTEMSEMEWAKNLLDSALERFIKGLN